MEHFAENTVSALQLHTYVEARLGRWGLYQRWLNYCNVTEAPYRVDSCFGMILDGHVQNASGGRAPMLVPQCPVEPQESQETTRCVAVLREERREIISELYVWGSRPVDIIKAIGCGSRQTYYNQLYGAYAELLGYFNDVAAGVPLPLIEPTATRGRTTRLRAVMMSRKYA